MTIVRNLFTYTSDPSAGSVGSDVNGLIILVVIVTQVRQVYCRNLVM